jgi:hypothetical protein
MSGYADTLAVTVLQPPVQIQERTFCVCGLACEYVEKAFAGANSYENDTSSFLYKKLRSADTIALELHKKGRKVASLNDNTLGTYYSTFSVQPLYVGFIVDWGLVFNAHGGGDYRIVARKSILGVSSAENSRAFYLNSFDDESANGTVKLSMNLNGNILSSIFDYTGLLTGGWVSNFRIPAKFGNKSPELTTDNYLSSEYKKISVVPSVSYEYTLATRLIPAVIADELNSNSLLSDSVKVTDYNLLNPRMYIDFECFPTGIELVQEADNKELYNVTFSDKFDNTRRTY